MVQILKFVYTIILFIFLFLIATKFGVGKPFLLFFSNSFLYFVARTQSFNSNIIFLTFFSYYSTWWMSNWWWLSKKWELVLYL